MTARKQPRWTPEMEKSLLDNYPSMGPKAMAELFGVSYGAVTQKYCCLTGGKTSGRPDRWTPEVDAAIREGYLLGRAKEIAEKYKIPRQTVSIRARELGIVGAREAGYNRKAMSTERCDIHYFDEWSPPMAYVLGFLFADGHVTKNGFTISVLIASADDTVLEFIKSELKSTRPIYRFQPKPDKRNGRVYKPKSQLNIGSTTLVNRLAELGLKNRKTYNDDPFPQIPDEFFGDFARGYLDGDGCVTLRNDGAYCRICFIGSPQFMTGFRDTLVRLAGVGERKLSKGNSKTPCLAVEWNRKTDVKKIHALLYPEPHCFAMARKRDKLAGWLKA